MQHYLLGLSFVSHISSKLYLDYSANEGIDLILI